MRLRNGPKASFCQDMKGILHIFIIIIMIYIYKSNNDLTNVSSQSRTGLEGVVLVR